MTWKKVNTFCFVGSYSFLRSFFPVLDHLVPMISSNTLVPRQVILQKPVWEVVRALKSHDALPIDYAHCMIYSLNSILNGKSGVARVCTLHLVHRAKCDVSFQKCELFALFHCTSFDYPITRLLSKKVWYLNFTFLIRLCPVCHHPYMCSSNIAVLESTTMLEHPSHRRIVA